MTEQDVRFAIMRTLTWVETLGYAPTRAELLSTLDVGKRNPDVPLCTSGFFISCLEQMIHDQALLERHGRLFFPASANTIDASLQERDPLQSRKRRRARAVVKWLVRLSGVRCVALANTTALGNARDEGDLDFFVIVRAGSIWTTRLLGALPFRLLRLTPRPGFEKDAVCLSYFIADNALNLSSHQLAGDDPYFRHWLLSLVPLCDDGVLADFWQANAAIRASYPFAERWIVPPDVAVSFSRVRFPVCAWFESFARTMQMKWFPPAIRERMNTDTTVMVTDSVLKFHTTDGRATYRDAYRVACVKRGV
jgi:hypothetical protein